MKVAGERKTIAACMTGALEMSALGLVGRGSLGWVVMLLWLYS